MELILGDCKDKLKELEDNSVDAIVTDPPYGLSFMGKKWDYDVPSVDIWKECLRVLKPGGYLLSFAGTRTQHRMAVNIEDAGFEIRDMIAWVYGSGFPKSLNIGKAVDKLQGNEREVGEYKGSYRDSRGGAIDAQITSQRPRLDIYVTKGTSQWEGWGTALKPALEPITVARKPLGEKTVAQNCLKWGVGGINIDGSRVEYKGESDKNSAIPQGRITTKSSKSGVGAVVGGVNDYEINRDEWKEKMAGRFPANLIHDGSDEVVGLLGEPARFFYCAKSSKRERNIGCEELGGNKHCTVKPLALMEYLVKLVSREGQVVLDPFMGSGTTGMACKKLNREFIGIEMMEEYMEIAKCRIEGVKKEEQLRLGKE